MGHKFLTVCGVMAVSATGLLADFSYHETTKITGGAMAGMMKMAGAFSKELKDSQESSVAIKGNKMVRRGAQRMSVIDLDAKTITEVDLQKKQYSVMTFDEMRQAMETMSKKMKEKNADLKFRVSAEATGKTKEIAGYPAKEVVMKMAMDVTDEKSKQSGSMVVITDLWMSDAVPGYGEVAAFHRKMAEELNWSPGGNMFMANPDMAKGMTEAFKEISKMNGAPVLQIVAMGPEGITPPSADAPPPSQQSQTPKPSAGSVLGGALGGSRLGGLMGRKKQQDPPPPPPEQAQQGQAQAGAGSMIEMRMEYSGFATSADASLFEIPSGFKQVESEMRKMK